MGKIARIIVVPAVLAALWSCSKANPEAPAFDGGSHPPGWIQGHGADFLRNPDQCRTCHGDEFQGGVAGGEALGTGVPPNAVVNGCFAVSFGATNCHGAPGPFGHPRQVSTSALNNEPTIMDFGVAHPAFAMAKPVGLVQAGVPAGAMPTGFVVCAKCHGALFDRTTFPGDSPGEIMTPDVFSCVGCHRPIFGIAAPHSTSPTPETGWGLTHQETDPGNGPACAPCHRNQKNLSDPAKQLDFIQAFTYNALASPGCFNQTLCHGLPDPHPEGWQDPALHGSTNVGAKAAPIGLVPGFVNCTRCHGTTFSNFTPGESRCVGCHTGTSAPHPADWRGEGTYTHQNTDAGNAPACAPCHRNGNNSPIPLNNPAPATTPPGCFNFTLCHGSLGVSPHPSGWYVKITGGTHGSYAVRRTPAASDTTPSGLMNCTPCHGANLRTYCAGQCHTPAHPDHWQNGHPSILTVSGNLNACAICHQTPVCSACHQSRD